MLTGGAKSDDTIPSEYPYSWSPGTALSIEDFVVKYKPSMVQNDGTKPWIWVRRKENDKSPTDEERASAVVEGAHLLSQVAARVEEIKNDASIPVRASKKTGAQSKKEVREQVQAEAAEKLKGISKKYGFLCGKWLIFAPSDKVDVIWSRIATSLASGPLSHTSAFCAKVATSPDNAAPGYQHVICIYMPDVYDKEDVTAVTKVLLRQHGLNLSGVKSDLYTTIETVTSMEGLDSKHSSGIPSTVWKNASLLKETEIKELKEAFYSELSASKVTTAATVESEKDSKTAGKKSKHLVKRKVAEDPFASEEETAADMDGKEEVQEGGSKGAKRKKIM